MQARAPSVLGSSKNFVNDAQCRKESNWHLHKYLLYITLFCAP